MGPHSFSSNYFNFFQVLCTYFDYETKSTKESFSVAMFFFSADRSFGISVFFCDSTDTLVQARTLCFPHAAPTVECEALTLLVAIQIAVESDSSHVNFESDCQTVVNAITNGDAYVKEFGAVLISCRSLFSSNACYNLSFIRRQANRVAHNLVRACIVLVSFIILLIVLKLLFVMK
jgi:hypothetical protein